MGSIWGSGIMHGMATLYIGYKPTMPGSIIGGIWGFFDAGLAGVIIAWLYNKISLHKVREERMFSKSFQDWLILGLIVVFIVFIVYIFIKSRKNNGNGNN